MKLFDFHVHCFPPALAERAVDSVKNDNPHKLAGTLDAQLDFMHRNGVDGCALLHMATRPSTMRKVNAFALSTRGENRFVFGSVHPDAPDTLQELDWMYEQGLRGVKFHTAHQLFRFDDPKYLPLYRHIGELGMVTLVHCGFSVRSADYPVWPDTVARVIEAFDGAPFIAAHMGGITPDDPRFELLRQMPVLVDTAMIRRRATPAELADMSAALGMERVLFGSDLPWASWQEAYGAVTEAAACRPDFDLEAVLWRNAQALTARYP